MSVADVFRALSAGDGDSSRAHPRVRNDDARPETRPVLSPEERSVVAQVRAGNEKALEQLFETYYGELRTIAIAMAGTALFADEVVDDVFEALWRVRAEWTPAFGIRAYLVRAVRNRTRNFLRAESSRARVVSEAGEADIFPGMGNSELRADERLDAEEVARIVWASIGRLSETTQLILSLRWRHGLSWDAIAHATGLSAGAVQMQHHRACKVLRDRLPKHLR